MTKSFLCGIIPVYLFFDGDAMLYLILSRARGGKTAHIMNLIEQFSKGGKEKITLIVPEQFSFTSEKLMLGRLGATVIEPSGDDSAESVDKECGFIVAGGVIAFGFETSAELLGIRFYIVKHPSKVLGGVAQIRGSCFIREHFQDGIFDFNFHIRSSFH